MATSCPHHRGKIFRVFSFYADEQVIITVVCQQRSRGGWERCINRCPVSLLPSWAAHFNTHQLLLCIVMHICQTLSGGWENAPTELQSRWAAGWLCCCRYCQWSCSKVKSLLFSLRFRPVSSRKSLYSSAQNVRRLQWAPLSLLWFHRNLQFPPCRRSWRAPVLDAGHLPGEHEVSWVRFSPPIEPLQT